MENTIDTIIGVNVSLKGNLYNKGSIQINGEIEGEIKSDENVLIGETASIKGPVVAKKIEVSGEIRGVVEASEKLEINSTGKIWGDINAKTLIIKEGALFVGQSIMPSANQPSNTKSSDPEKETTSKTSTQAPDKGGFFSKK
jgi:cytoskeletal protein CcmA (bactofilin family)